MSQQLTPINGGVQQIQTTTSSSQLLVLSQQYVKTNNLEERPTEWIPGGRPIYRRLPGASETYQIDFFNIVPAPNTAVAASVQDIGYVYIPWDGSSYGAGSLEVKAADTGTALLVNSGKIVWSHGTSPTLPTIVDLELLEVLSGQYEIAYQLIFDKSPIPLLYAVEDFSLSGQPLTITSSSDAVVGWRYPAVNAFLNATNIWWANYDSLLPHSNTYSVQPTQSFLQWESSLSMAYSRVVLRCPSNSAYTGTATLSYISGSSSTVVTTVSIAADAAGQYFDFIINSPVLQNGWNVTFSSLDMSIQSISVTGTITQLEPQAEASTRAVLVMYPTGSTPKTVIDSSGKEVPATYCPLALVDISNDYKILKIQDSRYIIHRDYMPVANWLTLPFDQDLISLYEQVSDYSSLWLAPPSCMKQEYVTLTDKEIILVSQ